MPKTIQLPNSLTDLVKDPQRVRDAIELLNALANLQLALEVPSGSNTINRGKPLIFGDPPNLILRLPFASATAIANPASTTAANNTAIIAILSYLRSVGFIPS